MKILVIGRGGREHAIVEAVYNSKDVDHIFACPGNPGIEKYATCIDIKETSIVELCQFAIEEGIDWTIVGPESSLALGIVDAFEQRGLKIFGPSQKAAEIESSKTFAKSLMKKYKIPSAEYEAFDNASDALNYLSKHPAPIVIKEDGLKAGKGVCVALDNKQAESAVKAAFMYGKNKIIIEEFLEGFEFSLIAFVHDELVIPMELAQDHKCVNDQDKGLNTGGMGVYSPVNKISSEIIAQTMNTIMIPVVKALKKEGRRYTGFLYGGFMLCNDGVKTIEFNARLGDPEAEVILPRLKNDFMSVVKDVVKNQRVELEWDPQTYVGVVMASAGYPNGLTKGIKLHNLDSLDSMVYHMGTREVNSEIVSDGGRVIVVVNKGNDLKEAIKKTYEDVSKLKCDGLFNRSDIGQKGVE